METDSATCQECEWNTSGAHTEGQADLHFLLTGHHWTLYRQAPDPRESKG